MSHKISTSRASWVNDAGEIDPEYLSLPSNKERRISTELIQPHTVCVPHLVWVEGDDDVLNKMRRRHLITSDAKANGDIPLIPTTVVPD